MYYFWGRLQRHEIIELLLKESGKPTKTNFASEISLTDEQISEALKIDLARVKGETEILDHFKHLNGAKFQNKLNISFPKKVHSPITIIFI